MYGGPGKDDIGDYSVSVEDEEAGNDYLNGGSGDDILHGGGGVDNMFGGGGADTLVFLSLAELDGDRVGDFDRRENDIINVSPIDAKPGGSDNEFKFIGDDSSPRRARSLFNDKNGKLKFNIDNHKGAEAVMLVNTYKLTEGDFDL